MRKATDIPLKVRERVLERDSIDGAPCCIYCGSPKNLQMAHFVPRSRGGKGVETNLACLCVACHAMFDMGDGTYIRQVFIDHLKSHYPGWSEEDQVYTKWSK